MQQKIKILHLEDVTADAELIAREIKKGKIDADIHVVTDKEQFIAALANFSYDIILSDHSLASFDSNGAIRLVKEAGISVPVILVTATMSDEFAAQVMKEGAHDYILKDRLNRLPSAVIHSIEEHVLKGEREAERRKADEEMQELTTRLQLATKSAGMGIWDWDLIQGNLVWDQGMYKLYDIDESQFSSVYEGWITRLHPDDRPRVDEEIQMALTGIKRYNTEFRIIWKDATIHTIRATGIIEKDHSETAVRMIGANWDITDRKLAEHKIIVTSESLQQALNDLQKIMSSSIDMICTIDKNGRFANVSSASAPILGYQPDELIGRKYIDLVFIEDVPKTNEVAASIMNGIPVTVFENRYMHKNGSLVPILWSASWDANDKLMYGIAKDATEKKKLEKAFKTERERINNLFLQSPSCMGVLKGPNHVYGMTNQLYLQLINKREIIGKTVAEVLPEVVEQGYIKLLDEVYETGKSFTANERLVKLDYDGTGIFKEVYVNILYQAYRDDNDKVEGVFFFTVDVTEQVLSRRRIEDSESRYRHIVETAKEGIWLIDENSKTTFVNKKMCELLEYSADEMMGRTNVSFKDEEHRTSAIRQLELR